MKRTWLVALAVVVAAPSCSSGGGVPSPRTEELNDGSLVWRIQKAECSENSDCGYGVYVNRWYYGIACVAPKVEESNLGPTFAIDKEDETPVDEARVIVGRPPSTLALHVQATDCAGWVESQGRFDDHGLDDPPADPQQELPGG